MGRRMLPIAPVLRGEDEDGEKDTILCNILDGTLRDFGSRLAVGDKG